MQEKEEEKRKVEFLASSEHFRIASSESSSPDTCPVKRTLDLSTPASEDGMCGQKHSPKIDFLGICPRGLRGACLETEFNFNVIQMEVEGEQRIPTGRFRKKRLNQSF